MFYLVQVQDLFGDVWQPRCQESGAPYPGRGGRSLKEYIADRGKIPLEVAHKIFEQLLSATMHLHSRGYAHCDIKPENILIDRDANVSNHPASLFGIYGWLE